MTRRDIMTKLERLLTNQEIDDLEEVANAMCDLLREQATRWDNISILVDGMDDDKFQVVVDEAVDLVEDIH